MPSAKFPSATQSMKAPPSRLLHTPRQFVATRRVHTRLFFKTPAVDICRTCVWDTDHPEAHFLR